MFCRHVIQWLRLPCLHTSGESCTYIALALTALANFTVALLAQVLRGKWGNNLIYATLLMEADRAGGLEIPSERCACCHWRWGKLLYQPARENRRAEMRVVAVPEIKCNTRSQTA